MTTTMIREEVAGAILRPRVETGGAGDNKALQGNRIMVNLPFNVCMYSQYMWTVERRGMLLYTG